MEKKKSLFRPINKELINALKSSKSIAIISHINPDGDAIFSSLALKSILEKMDKKVYLFNDGPFKRKEIMEYENLFSSSVSDPVIKEHPLVVILDCSTEDRPGNVYQALKENKTIVIDHHASGRPFYKEELSYIVPLSPSTTLLVDELREALGVELDRMTAEYLFIGFLTDTGFFHFISDEQAPESFEKVASFVSTGLNPYELYDRLHDGRKMGDIKRAALMIEKSIEELDGKVIIAYEPSDKDAKESAMEALSMVNLASASERNPYDLDLHERKLVALASVIAMDPDVIILDEPTIAQDDSGKQQSQRGQNAARAGQRDPHCRRREGLGDSHADDENS